MLASLAREDRLRLMKFLCSVAWADLEVRAEERAFVRRMVTRLGLRPDETAAGRDVAAGAATHRRRRPELHPVEHRKLFLDTLRELVHADGEVDEQEETSLALLEDLLASDA